jgi:hypothetical protein
MFMSDSLFPEREPRPDSKIGPELSQEPGFFTKNLGKLLVVGLGTTVFVGGILAYKGCSGSDPVVREKVQEPNPNATGGNQDFTSILASTQDKPSDSPRVLSNFDMSAILSGNYPTGSNSVEKISVSFSGCTGENKMKNGQVSGIVFRNTATASGFAPRFLTDEHINTVEELRTQQIELTQDKALLKPALPELSPQRQAQIVQAFGKLKCADGLSSLEKPVVTSRELIIGPEILDDQQYNFDNLDLPAGKIGMLLVGGVLVWGGYLLTQRKPKEKEQQK